MKRLAAVCVLLAVMCGVQALVISPAAAAGGDVILLHGWNGNAGDWSAAKAAYEAQGFTVHALQLPRSGGQAGDTAANADYVQAYMTEHGITSARLDSHSLGGWLALTIAFSRDDQRVTSVVMRDTGYGSGLGCWLVPDLCAGSPIVSAVEASATVGDPLPVLHLSSKTAQLPGVDCTKTYTGIRHDEYQWAASVTAPAVAWPGSSPCAPAPAPTPTPTPTCSWLARLWGLCR